MIYVIITIVLTILSLSLLLLIVLSLNCLSHTLPLGTFTIDLDQSSTDNVTAIVGGLFGGLIILVLVIGSVAVLIIILCLRRKGIVKNYCIFIIVIKTILVWFNLFVMYMQV